jgi:hypothetical protein
MTVGEPSQELCVFCGELLPFGPHEDMARASAHIDCLHQAACAAFFSGVAATPESLHREAERLGLLGPAPIVAPLKEDDRG